MQDTPNTAPPALSRAVFHILGAVALAAWLLAPLAEVLLLVFAGLLLATFITGVGAWVESHSFLSRRAASATFVLACVGLGCLIGWLAAPPLIEQVRELSETLPRAAERLAKSVSDYTGVDGLPQGVGSVGELLTRPETLSRARGFLSSTAGAMTSFVAFLFIGLFVAFEPDLYRRGLLHLIPCRRRARIDALLSRLGHAMHLWMLTKIVAMTVVGVATWLGLFLLGLPLASVLALLTALLTFIPNFGPVIAAVPPLLLALTMSPTTALLVGVLYVSVQTVESYLITPLMERKTIALPPALTLSAQLALGVLFGGIGVIIATPITLMALVTIKQLYVEDYLGDDP